jgi:CRP/FNR family cyclic AMP-dependent transcriptional regulator
VEHFVRQVLDALKILRAVGWLSRQPEELANAVLAAGEVVSVARGDRFYSLDDPTGGLFGIVSGYVEVLIAPGPLPPMLVHIGGPGWWVGEAALITRTRRRAELRARTNVLAVHVSAANIEAIAAADPNTWRRLAEISVAHLDDALSLAACLGTKDYERRLLLTLLRLAGPMAESSTTVSLPIGQSELGEIAGLSRNSIGRLLRRFRQAGTVEIMYGQIVIHPERLKAALLS